MVIRRRKILKLAKGFFGRAKNCIRLARIQVWKSLQHQYIGRKVKKREYRTMWIQGINAGLSEYNYRYSHFINHLIRSDIQLNRSVLSNMAQTEPYSFKAVTDVTRFLQHNRMFGDKDEIIARIQAPKRLYPDDSYPYRPRDKHLKKLKKKKKFNHLKNPKKVPFWKEEQTARKARQAEKRKEEHISA